MKIVGLLSQSFSDWPGHATAVLFTPGCNFRCPFCHNSEIILNTELKSEYEETVIEKLKGLRWSLDGVVITGGEPTLQPDLADFCKKLREIDYKIKLDTNGSNPELLKKLIDEKLIDYVAMDLKTTFEDYERVTKFKDVEKIKESIKILLDSEIDHEFRTTYVPDFIKQEDIRKAVSEIKNAKRYVIQKFIPRNCMDERFNEMKSPEYEKMKELADSLEFDGEIRLRGEHKETIVRRAK